MQISTSDKRHDICSYLSLLNRLNVTGTITTGLDAEVKELEDLKRRARVLRQQYAGTATSRPEVAKSLHAEVYKVGTLN